ncbi:alanine dehydrogenase/PNT, N-terminal domain protein [Bordetella holmesii 35009]|nr:alanine dehydrogenase/PNT, N-terminal domain protein [Bordetella holmesii 35009]
MSARHSVIVERGAGAAARYPDEAYLAAGATLANTADALGAPVVFKVRAPAPEELRLMRAGSVLAGMLDPFDADSLAQMAQAGLTAFALESARALRGHKAWMSCPRRPIWPVTKPSCWRPTTARAFFQ